MKKILIIIFLIAFIFVFICSCDNSTGKKIDDDAKIETVISNNSPYDENEDSTYDFSELLGSNNGIEIYGKNNLSFVTPNDGVMEVVLLIKNTNEFDVQLFQDSSTDINSDNFSGSITNYCRDYTTIVHPNGSDFLIEKGNEMTFIIDISLPNFNNQNESLEGDLIFSYNFIFKDYSNGSVVSNINLAINSNIKYLGREERSDVSKQDGVIKGVVVDSNNSPINGVEIEYFNAIDENPEIVTTNENGEFEFKVMTHKSNVSNMWHECLVTFKHPNYSEKVVCVYPKSNEENELTVVLDEPSLMLSYTNTSTIDLGIQAYSYDTDENKSIISFIPFHSGLNYSEIKDKVNLTVTDYDGNLLFKYQLNAETPWVSISDDGKYIVTSQAISEGNEYSTDIVILNNQGETVYSKSITKEVDTSKGIVNEVIHSRCAEFSHDSKYLLVGSDDGDIYMIDWQNNMDLWTYKTHGQVRHIIFDYEDSTIFVSSGDGYMYCFDIDGNLKFKTYVGSWATDMELAGDKLVYTLKTSWNSLGAIDITSGDVIWTYQTLARGSGLAISKDNKYVWFGNDVSSSYSVISNAIFDISTGEISYVLNHDSGQEAMFSDDGRYLVVKTATKLEVFETTNYSCVYQKEIIDPNGENAASINQTILVNSDASKIVAAFNSDSSSRFYGQAYYFVLD